MPERRMLTLLVLLAVLDATYASAPAWSSRSGDYRVSYESEINPPVINRIHSWTLVVTESSGAPVEGATISIDGGMPAHDHGLPTAPRVTSEIAPGRYLLEGVRFHMAGAWEIVVTIEVDDKRDTVVIPLEL